MSAPCCYQNATTDLARLLDILLLLLLWQWLSFVSHLRCRLQYSTGHRRQEWARSTACIRGHYVFSLSIHLVVRPDVCPVPCEWVHSCANMDSSVGVRVRSCAKTEQSTGCCMRGIDSLIATLKLQSNGPSYSNTVIGTLPVDVWAVTFGTAMRGLGGAAARPGRSSLYQM